MYEYFGPHLIITASPSGTITIYILETGKQRLRDIK